MVPVECYWGSNLNGPAIRWRISSLAHNQQKWNEAVSKLGELTNSEPSLILDKKQIQIDTIEQLKLLHAVSKDLEEEYFTVFSFNNW